MLKNPNLAKRNAAGDMAPEGLYHPSQEHDSCGIGLIAKINGDKAHSIVSDGVQILINLEHRGAVGGDNSTGDGGGLLLQLPDAFFRKNFKDSPLPKEGEYGVGMIFLPTDKNIATKCKETIERLIKQEKLDFLGWRDVPIDISNLGILASSTAPFITQCFIGKGDIEVDKFERKLYILRRVMENGIKDLKLGDSSQFYITSLSSKTIIYKGLLTGNQISDFYPDIKDESFTSAFAIVHQRYSTNTLPTWNLAQPFRYMAHNGEINTLRGNINRMKSREAGLKSELFGEEIEKIKPIIVENGSDSAVFDNVLELLVQAGRSIPHAMMMMIPEAFGEKFHMSADKRAFYEFHSAIMEPWDGPAAVVFTDGRYIGGTLDRNGLRPSRYTITKDGSIIMASETGVLEVEAKNVLKKGRLQPGKMFLVDLEQKRIVPDNEIKSKISRRQPYRRWVRDNRIELRGLAAPSKIPTIDLNILNREQVAFGYTEDELKTIIKPMASNGQEGMGSMGDDSALAVFSNRPQLLFAYFRQLFAQVTNPPIDPYREELVMSLMNHIGHTGNLLDEKAEQFKSLRINHPIFTPKDLSKLKNSDNPGLKSREIDILFPAGGDGIALEKALDEVFEKCKKAIEDKVKILILTDKNMSKDRAAIPVLLATAGLHHYLIKNGLRTKAGIIPHTGEAREIMHFALLVGYGAKAICPHTAFSTIKNMTDEEQLDGNIEPEIAMDNYITAIKKGFLKSFSRMGISTIRSYFSAQIFEALGIHSDVVNKYFCDTPTRIGGLGLNEIAIETNMRHTKAYARHNEDLLPLGISGGYALKKGGEKHLWTPESIYKLQHSVRTSNYDTFKEYTSIINDQSKEHATLRSLLKFKKTTPISINEVESVEDICKRFASAAMSLGSLSIETHETIAIAMNSIGAKSNSGEGGEDPSRFKKEKDGTWKRSAIKQIASGRFGVTIHYLANSDELQIKMAQGAKPGEGGQLPGHKVSEEIARVRHTTPGVTLISPPPHHDIYSIEDLAQLIYDLKCSNTEGKVSVKLVSEVGVGTIASGVAKAKADTVLISGSDGGTGASPLTSIKYAGLPWELGLAEAQQSLVKNQLRDQITVQTDGQLKTGRDLAIAVLLGAEEYGFGTTLLVTLGCVLLRKCHLNTCAMGVATQDKKLREKFSGKPEYIVNFLKFIAQELREYMAELGFKTIDDMVGRSDLLDVDKSVDHWKAKTVDLTNLLYNFKGKEATLRCTIGQKHDTDKSLDMEIIKQAKASLENKEKTVINLPIRNIHRTVGTILSSQIAKKYEAEGLPAETITINLKGSAGQSFGAFLAPGITMNLEGDANDYIGKGMSGGKIIINPDKESTFRARESIIAGNTILYGATAGELYIQGMAGERFAVRNSGAKAVLEGVGDHGCEYMTGGTVVILGSTGNNFAAGMSGGIAYVYDKTELFDTKCNLDMVDIESVWLEDDVKVLKKMVEDFYKYTKSRRAERILENWEAHLPLFVKVMPIEYKKSLERTMTARSVDDDTVSATEEVYNG